MTPCALEIDINRITDIIVEEMKKVWFSSERGQNDTKYGECDFICKAIEVPNIFVFV